MPAQAHPGPAPAAGAAADVVARFSIALREAIGGKRGAP
jgi:hypothetical protein